MHDLDMGVKIDIINNTHVNADLQAYQTNGSYGFKPLSAPGDGNSTVVTVSSFHDCLWQFCIYTCRDMTAPIAIHVYIGRLARLQLYVE